MKNLKELVGGPFLYVLMLDGKILTPDSFKEYWKHYGAGGSVLQGWRPPKKIYYTLGQATNGLRFVPKEIRDRVKIFVFEPAAEISIERCVICQKILKPTDKRGLGGNLHKRCQPIPV